MVCSEQAQSDYRAMHKNTINGAKNTNKYKFCVDVLSHTCAN